MRLLYALVGTAMVAALVITNGGPLRAAIWRASAGSHEVGAAIAPDTFGIAHISAVNSQSATYSALRYQQARDAGATWNRWVFYWQDIEQSSGSPGYWPQDTTAAQDAINGFDHRINAVLMGSPGWATTGGLAVAGATPPPPRVGEHSYGRVSALGEVDYAGASSATYPPQHLYDSVFADNSDVPGPGKSINQGNYWARFVYNTVLRFKDRVRHWEIWNEPDYLPNDKSAWFGFWSGTADEYYRLLKVAYLAAKAADPNAVVVMGGMAFWPEIVQQGKPPFTFFKRVLTLATTDSLGASNNRFFDATAWHWYNRSSQSYDKVLETRVVLNSYGLGAKPIWLNESGMPVWNDTAKPPPGGNNAYFGSGTMTEQASYVMQAMAYGLAAGVERNFIFQEYDDGNGEAFGLLRNDGSARPAYYAYRMAARYLAGTTSASHATQGTASVVTASTPGGRVVALWNNSPTAMQASVTASASSALLLWQPTEANPAGTQQTVYPSGGRYSIWLPGATNANGVAPGSDYIVGGLVALIVEETPVTPTPSPTPVLCPAISNTGLIANGGFEQNPGLADWVTTTGSLPPQVLSATCGHYAVLGRDYVVNPSIGGANSTLEQVVTLPAGTGPLTLRFRYALVTSQPTPANIYDPYSYDKFEVLLFDWIGARHDLLVDWTPRPAWIEQSLDLSAYRGQRVRLTFNVWQSDATTLYPTQVYLDDVRLWPHTTQLPNVQKNR